MKVINLESIKALDPCKDGLDNFIKYYKDFEGSLAELLSLEHIPYNDKVWVASKVCDIKILQHWGVECAKSVLHLYENKYPNDNRVRDCINTTFKYLQGEVNIEELIAAESAAESAARSAAAESAEYAAMSAECVIMSARYAVRSAEYTAAARSAAAKSAAAARAAAARSAAMSAAITAAITAQEDINLNLLIALL